jgi:Fe-S-cluster containining protein
VRLVEVLGARGVVSPEDLGLVDVAPEPAPTPSGSEDVAAAAPDPGGAGLQPRIDWPTVALRVDDDNEDGDGSDDAAFVAVDCAARMHVCHAVCCRLKFPLSCGEVDAGKVKWDIGHPYIIRHDSSGWCAHNDRETGCCGVYDDRPAVCRRYSCAGDQRIWKDFDAMVLNQEWIDENLTARDFYVESIVPTMEAAP